MKFFVQHPYKERIELKIGAITQIVGQNKELKYYTWQILSWYFGGKKYSSEDLSIFNYEEPTILDEVEEIVKRSSYHYIDISSFKDLLEQMEYKKGTLAHGYLSKFVNQVDIIAHLEKINEQVELIEGGNEPEYKLKLWSGGIPFRESPSNTRSTTHKKLLSIFCH